VTICRPDVECESNDHVQTYVDSEDKHKLPLRLCRFVQKLYLFIMESNDKAH
jgi:hypothetical protein